MGSTPSHQIRAAQTAVMVQTVVSVPQSQPPRNSDQTIGV